MVDYYSIDVKCQNCKKWHWIKIPVGTSVEEFGREENKVCQYCGCEIIKVKEIREKDPKPTRQIEVDEDNSNLK